MNNTGSDTSPPPDPRRSHPMIRPDDGRSAEARRHKVLVADILSYLEIDDYGTHHQITKAETALAESAAALTMRLDVFNMKIVAGETVNVSEHLSISKARIAALDALGILPLKPKRGRH